jgi:RNA polymerase sigma-70 factor (ECF subfamily)
MSSASAIRRESTVPVHFEDFFRSEYPRLVPMVHALLGDRDRAEDVAQEALAAAQQAWPTVSRYERPGAWVRRVALNRTSNVRRRRGREVVALRRASGAPAPESVEEPAAGDERLWRLVRDLPEQQRFAVVLYYVEDRSVAEVAGILQCSEGSVKTHLSRARAALARALGDTPEEANS